MKKSNCNRVHIVCFFLSYSFLSLACVLLLHADWWMFFVAFVVQYALDLCPPLLILSVIQFVVIAVRLLPGLPSFLFFAALAFRILFFIYTIKTDE